MNKTKIEWADMTWNPVTGCLHGCEYCYARKIADRFGGYNDIEESIPGYPYTDYDLVEMGIDDGKLHDLEYCEYFTPKEKDEEERRAAPFPYYFSPTLHRYRLDEPQKIRKPQNIFVCSMADLFGEWVPDEWIEAVFEACKKAPWHRYLFLTKNPKRYVELHKKGILPDSYKGDILFGATVTTDRELRNTSFYNNCIDFLSIEPIKEYLQETWLIDGNGDPLYDWLILGAETGNRKGKIIPKREWIETIVNKCRQKELPLLMKNSLSGIWQDKLVQQFPWEAK